MESWFYNLIHDQRNSFVPVCPTDVSLEIIDELDLTHLRATGLQPGEEQLPEGEQPTPGKNFLCLVPYKRVKTNIAILRFGTVFIGAIGFF